MKKGSIVLNVLIVFFVSIFIVNYIRLVFGTGTTLTFSGFLDLMTHIKSIDLKAVQVFGEISGSWGFFDFFRQFLNTLGYFTNVSLFICANIINALLLCMWVVTSVFFIV